MTSQEDSQSPLTILWSNLQFQVVTTSLTMMIIIIYLFYSTTITRFLFQLFNDKLYGLLELISNTGISLFTTTTTTNNNQNKNKRISSSSHLLLSSSNHNLSFEKSPLDDSPEGHASSKKLEARRGNIYYAGLINSSSNQCFLNAVLQSLASMPHVIRYLNLIESYTNNLPSSYNTRTPVAKALRDLLVSLNTPRDHSVVLKPYSITQALLLGHSSTNNSTLTSGGGTRLNNFNSKTIKLFNSEQQDAQEFLVTMIDALEIEANILAKKLLLNFHSFNNNNNNNHVDDDEGRNFFYTKFRSIQTSPFRGLMAHRIACATCGFTSVIRHSSADHFSLNVPPKTSCRLETCLQEYTKLEVLDEYICRKCSLNKTYEKYKIQLEEELDKKDTNNNNDKKKKNKKKKKENKRMKNNLELIKLAILEDPERDLPHEIKVERVASLATTKQTMFARPPDSLTFHISRSTSYSRGVTYKNHCQVIYPEELNLDSFCTTCELSGDATKPISPPPPSLQKQQQDDNLNLNLKKKIDYRYKLSSVVVHFGSHSFGHYITFRKAPHQSKSTTKSNLNLKDKIKKGIKNQVINDDDDETSLDQEEEEEEIWYRISDETVQISSVQDALRSNPFLLMYERVYDNNYDQKDEGGDEEVGGEGGHYGLLNSFASS